MIGITAAFLAMPTGSNEPGTTGVFETIDATPSSGTPTTFPGKITRALRNITVEEYGIFSTRDEIWFENDADVPISHVYVCLNQTHASALFEMRVHDVAGTRLRFEELTNLLAGFVTWRVILPRPVLPGNQRIITVFQHFHDIMDVNVTTFDQVFVFSHAVFTITPHPAEEMRVEVKLPSIATIKSFSPSYGVEAGYILRYSALAAEPFNFEPLHVTFSSTNSRLVETVKAHTTIRVNNDRDWTVRSEIEVLNIGKVSLLNLYFHVPGDAYGIVARDSIGIINGLTTMNSTMLEGMKEVSILLTANRYIVTRDTKFSLRLQFSLPAAPRMWKGDLTSHVELDLFRTVVTPWVMRDVQVRVSLPQSTSINFDLLNVLPEMIDNVGGEDVLIFARDAVSPVHTQLAYIEFSYSTFQLQARPLLIALVFGCIATVFVVARKATMGFKPVSEIVEAVEVPMDALGEFTTIFEEKVGLYIEMDRLNDNLKRGKIKKREYVIKIEESTKRVKNLDEDVKLAKRRLMDFGGRLREIVEELDVYEAERQAVQDALVGLERRYKEGKIKSRVAYEKLYDTYSSRLKRIQAGLDSGTNELKSYLT